MRFIVDMCMDVRVASWLNSQGHDATHLRDEGLQRLPDGGVFEKAIAESRVVVTFDLDYGEIVALSNDSQRGRQPKGSNLLLAVNDPARGNVLASDLAWLTRQ